MRMPAIGDYGSSTPAGIVDLTIDSRDFSEPDMTFFVFHIEDVVDGPMEVISDVAHFLIQLFTWVCSDRRPGYPGPDWPLPPSSVIKAPVTMSTSISC